MKERLGAGKVVASSGGRVDVDWTVAFALIEHREDGSITAMVEDGNHDVLNVIFEIEPRLLEGEGIGQWVAVSLEARKRVARLLHSTRK